LMYAYSTPYDEVARIAASMAVPMLRLFLRPNRWTRVPGGMSRYVDRVAQRLCGEIVLGARLRGVRRTKTGVDVVDEAGHTRRFDRVVLAVPPHRVLQVLLDPSDDERTNFESFAGRTVETWVHTDAPLHARFGATHRSEFDLFDLPNGVHGYDAYLNRLAGLPTETPPHYSLAYGLDQFLDERSVIHRQRHDVAIYSDRALASRAAIDRAQGERSTYVVGAFLGDGLHEGAVRSALHVADRLGGRTLDA
jgi:predicted NAD/FAD-binding protein